MNDTTAQPFTSTIPSEIRAELIHRVSADLLGPLDGDHEVIRGYQLEDDTWSSPDPVRNRYLVGMLTPSGTVAADPERDDDSGPEADDRNSGVALDERTPGVTMARSSFGLSVVIEGTVSQIKVACRWGHYQRRFEDQPDGTRASVWVRSPKAEQVTVALRDGEIGPVPVNGEGVVLRGRAVRSESDHWLLTLFLVNGQEQVDRYKDSRWLFQAEMELAAWDDSPIFIGRDQVISNRASSPESERDEMARLELQYRDVVEFAVGHGVGAQWKRSPENPRRAVRVTTAAIPRHEVGQTRSPTPDEVPELSGLVTDMKVLSELQADDLRIALSPLADGYRAWLNAQEQRIHDPADHLIGHEDTADAVLAEARGVADAIAAGIEVVCRDPDALDAFRFANQTMWRQRVHTVAFTRRRSESTGLTLRETLTETDVPDNRSWRPFQLAFVLLCLPSLTDPAHPERSGDGEDALADLLFFPTGGGKTEAYLGLVAYTLAIRRMQGVVGVGDDAVDGRHGVTVLMRYTLRLLTAQQFQRAATLICAAELLRQQRARSDPRYAGSPFRLGMWVGSAVSPNKSSDAQKFVEDARLGRRGWRQSNPLQLTDCPWRGTELDPSRDLSYESGPARLLVFCNDRECPFTRRNASGEGIPVVTVDEEIYRLAPSFVIATIDKFAQLPWKGAVSTLFGRVDRRCERHGYRNDDLDRSHHSHWQENDSHKSLGELPAARTVPVRRLRPPDLILQDEMHLITGPLGTIAGLYETAVDRLATWTYNGLSVRPKVVASTATIRRASTQTWSIFWRKLRVFPPPVLDAGQSFFAEQIEPSPDSPGRLYLGVCAHGERLKQVELRVFASLMAAAKAIFDELDDENSADPWMTTVGYFNSIRELGGMRRMAEDELRAKLRRTRHTTGLADRRSIDLVELTSRVSSEEIKQILSRLFVTHESNRDRASGRPIDLLLATNMISVGIDVPRFASMVVVGQPKATAEYIQATSRVGRDKRSPGLVITIYNWARPRDLSHYETFAHYHATFYRNVEPLSVTPFSDRALDKGLTGVLVSAVRHSGTGLNANNSARSMNSHDDQITAHVAAIADRAAQVSGNHTGGMSDESVREFVEQMADKRFGSWENHKKLYPQLSFEKHGGDNVALLTRPEAGDWGIWTCPNSMRDTEIQANLLIDDLDPTYESGDQPSFVVGSPDRGAGRERPVTAADEEIQDEEGDE